MEEGSGVGRESGPCQDCKTWEEKMYWKHFNSMHFSQILPKDFQHHLELPAKFAENMTAELPNKLTLIGPSGTIWNVEVSKTNKIEFVGDGWKDFVKAHDLEEDFLLMFKYKRNLTFEVLIFDHKSLCEKEAAYFVKKCRHSTNYHENQKKRKERDGLSVDDVEEEGEGDETENDSEFVSPKKCRTNVVEELVVCSGPKSDPQTSKKCKSRATTTRGRGRPKRVEQTSISPSKARQGRGRPKRVEKPRISPSRLNAQSGKELKGDEAGKEHSDIPEREKNTLEIGGSTLEASHSDESSETSYRPQKRGTPKHPRKLLFKDAERRSCKEYISNRRPVTEEEKKNALEKANQALTEKSFIVVMRPTAVYKRFYLNIPADWMNKHLPRRNTQVVLRVGEKTWSMTFYYNGRKTGGLSGGWKKFALDNFLEEFDVCLFKVASQKDDVGIVMDVDIFRVIPEITPPSPVGSSTLT